jgi:uncharacterized protein involved in propanediol utilization
LSAASANPPDAGVFAQGICQAHHGEILQGQFTIGDKTMHGLVTMPLPTMRSTAYIAAGKGYKLVVYPPHKTKAAQAAELALECCGAPTSGLLLINSEIEEGLGLGSSTADVIASIRAVAAYCGTTLSDSAVAKLAVRAECASDAIMFDRAVLFAHRRGEIIEDFRAALPPMVMLGVVVSKPVNTLELRPAAYSEFDIRRFDALREQLRDALARRDVAGIGAVATASSRINQRHLPFALFEALEGIADWCGAVGLQVAHSGAVTGLMFDASLQNLSRRVDDARKRVLALGVPHIHSFVASTAPGLREAA